MPVPHALVSRLLDGDIPDPARDQSITATVIRCWWVVVRADEGDDGERSKPVRFCVEVPAAVVGEPRN